MSKNSDLFSVDEARKMAESEAGQQLLSMIRRAGEGKLQQAAALAAAGQIGEAKALLAPLLEDPDARELLSRLGG
ncbi:MAG: hypothetical protein ACI3VZ_03010 [Faecousia sp.]